MITCSEYDHIEIVCLYHYPIEISLKSGKVLTCIAIDTKRNIDRMECIEVDVRGDTQLVLLDNIAKLVVTIENPHFKKVNFD